MMIWDFKPKGDLVTTLAVGVGVAAAPRIIPLAWYAVRPLLKSILKGGFMIYESGRRALCEASATREEGTLKKGRVTKREKIELLEAHETKRAPGPKSEDVKASATERARQKSTSKTQGRRQKKVGKSLGNGEQSY